MFLVDGLATHAHALRDRLPRPALLARPRDLKRLESLSEFTQAGDGPQSDRRVAARGLFGELDFVAHAVNVG